MAGTPPAFFKVLGRFPVSVETRRIAYGAVMDQSHNHPRFVQGRKRLAGVVRLLLDDNQLSHADMVELYRWAAPDTGTWLSTSQLSTLRNAKLPKPGPQLFDVLGEVNLRLAQLAGDDSPAVRKLSDAGPLPTNLRRLRDEPPFFLKNPETGLAMDAGDLFRLFIGRLEFDDDRLGMDALVKSDEIARRLSEDLAMWAQRWMLGQGLLLTEAKGKILNAYEVADPKRQQRLWSVLLKERAFTGQELTEELDGLRFLVGRLERGSALSHREFDNWCRTGQVS